MSELTPIEKEMQDTVIKILSDDDNKKALQKHKEMVLMGYPHAIRYENGKIKIVDLITTLQLTKE